MKKIYLFVFPIVLFFVSCSGDKDKKDQEKIIFDTNPNQAEVPPPPPLPPPPPAPAKYITSELTKFISYLDSVEFENTDTLRLKKVAGYSDFKDAKIYLVKNKPFYLMNKSKYGMFKEQGFFEMAANLKTFQSYLPKIKAVKNIYGYFFTYKDLKDDRYGTDATIEIWEFENDQGAENAWDFFKNCAYSYYFNTGSVFVMNGNYIYAMSSRSAGGCYDLKPVEKEFLKTMNGVVSNHWVK